MILTTHRQRSFGPRWHRLRQRRAQKVCGASCRSETNAFNGILLLLWSVLGCSCSAPSPEKRFLGHERWARLVCTSEWPKEKKIGSRKHMLNNVGLCWYDLIQCWRCRRHRCQCCYCMHDQVPLSLSPSTTKDKATRKTTNSKTIILKAFAVMFS